MVSFLKRIKIFALILALLCASNSGLLGAKKAPTPAPKIEPINVFFAYFNTWKDHFQKNPTAPAYEDVDKVNNTSFKFAG